MAVTLHAATITVTNTNDSGAGSLRAAIQVANDGDTIDATGVSGTILLTSGQLYINPSVTIIGPGAGNLAVNGNATFRVFQTEGSNTTISGLTITNGVSENGLGGGGILNHGGLTVIDTSIVNNDGGDDGGGIYSTFGALPQTLTVMNSTISNNVPGGIEVCCAYETLTGGGLAFTFAGLLFASVLYSLPFAVRPFAAAFAAVDRRLVEASWCLGVSRLWTFFRVVLPVAGPGILAGVVLTFAHTMGEFGVVLMMASI